MRTCRNQAGVPLFGATQADRSNTVYQSAGDLEDVRTYGYKAERAAALIYAHFKKEFGVLPVSN
jgi:hypothetical protein